MILVLSRGASLLRTAGRRKGCWCSIAKWRSGIARWSRSAPTTSARLTNIAAGAEPTDLFYQTQAELSKRTYNGYWFFGRPTVEGLRQDLRAVTRKCRPDWDITTPELKAAWQQGRKDLFYPYGKTFAQTLGAQD